ncbi:MAG TPA: hypothetical protein VME46_18005, partial [Acidimicrobiales bacterium]|nr:hypothetical protein [Acidimicrobiales bacterium]
AALEISSWFVGTVWSRSVVSLEERAKVAGLATEAAAGGSKAATKLQVGVNLLQDDPSLVESVYGLTDAQAANVSALAKDENALIAVRSRNPQSIEAEQLWGAFNKPASIKMKSVDQVDVDLLGYPKTVTVNGVSGPSEGLVVWRDPAQSAAYLAAHSAGVDPVLLQAAESRLALRTTEWQKYQASLAHYVQDGLPVEFNYAANGLSTTEPMPGYNLRQFKLKPVGDGTYLPLVMNNSRALVPITGDVDVVAVTSTNGTLLTPQQRLTIYQSLQSADGVGMQHGETLSWLTGGEGQVKLLTDHVGENAERLLVFDPVGGARTATIDAAHTTFTAKDNSLNGVWYIGAYKTPFASAFQNVVVTLQQANELVTPYIGPTSWWLTGPGAANSGPPPTGNNNGQLGGCDWEFSSGGVTLQPGGNGGLQQYVNGQWQTYQPPAACTSGSGSDIPRTGALGKAIIEVAPQSALLYGATPGSRRISLIPLAFVDPYVKAKDTAWFAPGETIMLDPGGGDQEAATIARVAGSTVTLSKPLQFGHAGGEMVTVLARPHGGRRSQGAYVPALLMPLVPVCRRRRSKRGRVALRPLSRGHKLVAGERIYR